MSTIKADAVTAVSAGGDLSLDGLGTGGVSIASTLKMTKGGDISSASPLVIDTDGNYFDVTGTTNFAAMTVESGNFFMLQFDGALTITHGSGIELPGASDLTTATGDRLICYATAADTVEVMSVETEAAASAGFTLATEQATTSGTAITFGSIPSGTTMIIINYEAVSYTSGNDPQITIGDSGGLETASYVSTAMSLASGGSPTAQTATAAFIVGDALSAGAAVWTGQAILTLKDSSNFTWICTANLKESATQNSVAGGQKSLSAELTQLSLVGGTFDAGSVNIMYQ
jgi:hypothetical protein